MVSAAEAGGATHVDIAADPALVKLAASLTRLPICVSAVEPEARACAPPPTSLVPATRRGQRRGPPPDPPPDPEPPISFAQLLAAGVAAGAHMVELGNYDPFYAEGRTFSAQEVLALTAATRALLPSTPLSVTVPHSLPLDEQVALAVALQHAGADIIQTEGGVVAAPSSSGVLGLVEKAAPTLAAAWAISAAVSVPVMCASGLSHVTAPMALAAGAAGVGVGSAVNRLNEPVAMIAAVRAVSEAMRDAATKRAQGDSHVEVSRIHQ